MAYTENPRNSKVHYHYIQLQNQVKHVLVFGFSITKLILPIKQCALIICKIVAAY